MMLINFKCCSLICIRFRLFIRIIHTLLYWTLRHLYNSIYIYFPYKILNVRDTQTTPQSWYRRIH